MTDLWAFVEKPHIQLQKMTHPSWVLTQGGVRTHGWQTQFTKGKMKREQALRDEVVKDIFMRML